MGVILHGSLTLGDYVPEASDVDLLVVVTEPLNDERVVALIEAATAEHAALPTPVDIRLITLETALHPTPRPLMEAYIRLPGGAAQARVEGRHTIECDLVVELSICRAHGLPLAGPQPADLIGDVPAEWVLSVGDAQLSDWQEIGDDPPYAALKVLTACRLWRFAVERRHSSKPAAAEWALARNPMLNVVRAALRPRGGEASDSIDGAEVQNLLTLVRSQIALARDIASSPPDV